MLHLEVKPSLLQYAFPFDVCLTLPLSLEIE